MREGEEERGGGGGGWTISYWSSAPVQIDVQLNPSDLRIETTRSSG
jgi:protein subunit release factor B